MSTQGDSSDRGAHRVDEMALTRITSDPHNCGGRPRIRGTRVRVSDLLDVLAHGASRTEILADFAYLADEDITAALAYAARSRDHRTELPEVLGNRERLIEIR